MQNRNSLILILIGAAAIFNISHASGPDELEQQQTEYCEMTKLFQETGGQYGWPDYRGNAEEVCK
jgi:hypothetical protein